MFWEVLNKIAIIGTIIGIPATIYGLYAIIFKIIVVYDMYREVNESGGYTVCIGSFTRLDKCYGKKENIQRQYHQKGKSQDKKYWK